VRGVPAGFPLELAIAIHLGDLASTARNLDRLTKTLEATVSRQRLSSALLADAQGSLDRRTTSYQSALTLIGILFEGKGVSLEGQAGRLLLPGFLFDMNRFFQELISRFLRDHLADYDIEDEGRLRGLFSYDSSRNPQGRQAPVQKPDFVIRAGREIKAILDAKYRDLWEKPLPRDMLYQLSLYALGRRDGDRKAVILYPTLAANASEQVVRLQRRVSNRARS
jgi:5-methylcytosine-specific restriction enzyme subunit McrC